MESTELIKVGFKIAATVLAGVAAFVGISRAFNEKRNPPRMYKIDPVTGRILGDVDPAEMQQESSKEGSESSEGKENAENNFVNPAEENVGLAVLDGLKKTQGITDKFTTMVQTLSTVTETFVRLFDKKAAQYLMGGGCNAGGFQQGPSYYPGTENGPFYNPYNNPWVTGNGNNSANLQNSPYYGLSDGHYWRRVDKNVICCW